MEHPTGIGVYSSCGRDSVTGNVYAENRPQRSSDMDPKSSSDSAGHDDDSTNLVRRTFDAVVETTAGILASDKKDLVLAAGRLLRVATVRDFSRQFLEEWGECRRKAKIADDYEDTEQFRECLRQLLEFLDNDPLDPETFKVLKGVFLAAAAESRSDRSGLLAQQYMRVGRDLSGCEVLVMRAAYELAKSGTHVGIHFQGWLDEVAKQSGLVHSHLVAIQERKLMDKHLLTSRVHHGTGIDLGDHFRLTDLGYGLCQFLDDARDGVQPDT